MRVTRRDLLRSLSSLAASSALGPGAVARGADDPPFRLAVCNETFGQVPLGVSCRMAREAGYTGVEIAPATLADDPASLPVSRRGELRQAIASEGIAYVGLHALLSAPKGLHVTTPDASVRKRSWEYVRRLIDLCADLGPGGIMVLGSARQRSTTGGSTVADAEARLRDGLAEVAPSARDRGVLILLEPSAPHLSDVVTSLGRAVAIVEQVGSPAVSAMFDFHNAVAEAAPHADLVRAHFRSIRHVHLSEMDGRHPGTGPYDYRPVLRALKDLDYRGWLSLEVFDFGAGGETIARDSARFIRRLEARLR